MHVAYFMNYNKIDHGISICGKHTTTVTLNINRNPHRFWFPSNTTAVCLNPIWHIVIKWPSSDRIYEIQNKVECSANCTFVTCDPMKLTNVVQNYTK